MLSCHRGCQLEIVDTARSNDDFSKGPREGIHEILGTSSGTIISLARLRSISLTFAYSGT